MTAQRSAQEVLDAACAEAKRIHNDAEIEASDIVDRANAEKAKIETAIEELDRSHKKTCGSVFRGPEELHRRRECQA